MSLALKVFVMRMTDTKTNEWILVSKLLLQNYEYEKTLPFISSYIVIILLPPRVQAMNLLI